MYNKYKVIISIYFNKIIEYHNFYKYVIMIILFYLFTNKVYILYIYIYT